MSFDLVLSKAIPEALEKFFFHSFRIGFLYSICLNLHYHPVTTRLLLFSIALATKRSTLLVEYSNFKKIQITQKAHALVYSLKPLSNIDSLTLTLGTPPPYTPPKQKTRNSKASASSFYGSSWLTSPDAFLQAVAHFKNITTH